MSALVTVIVGAVFVIYSLCMVFIGMAVATKYNRQAWEKFYEGRKDR